MASGAELVTKLDIATQRMFRARLANGEREAVVSATIIRLGCSIEQAGVVCDTLEAMP